jgi:hypothetical protein
VLPPLLLLRLPVCCVQVCAVSAGTAVLQGAACDEDVQVPGKPEDDRCGEQSWSSSRTLMCNVQLCLAHCRLAAIKPRSATMSDTPVAVLAVLSIG